MFTPKRIRVLRGNLLSSYPMALCAVVAVSPAAAAAVAKAREKDEEKARERVRKAAQP